MKSKFLAAIALLSTAAVFTACDKENGDTTKPTIDVVNPANDAILYIGDVENCLYIKFADDTELRSWAVEVHNNFKEHNHSKSEGHHHDYTEEEIANAYVLKKTSFDFEPGLRNTSVDIDDLLVIPYGVTPGSYHLGVYCIDAAGNQSEAWSKIEIAPKDRE